MAAWLWTIPAEHFAVHLRTGTLAVRRQGLRGARAVRAGDRIVVYLSSRRVVAGLFEATGTVFEDPTPLVPGGHYRHRLRVRPLVVLDEEVWLPYDAFGGKLSVLAEYADRGDADAQFRAVAQQVVHPLPELDAKVLEFLVRARAGSDFPALQRALDAVRVAQAAPPAGRAAEPRAAYASGFDRAAALDRLIGEVEAAGFVYHPWEVAAFVAALRTKPFVLLAGVTGVGKSRLPALVAEATGAAHRLIPVRPDWTDPAEALGYTDLQERFRPGAVLRAAEDAAAAPQRFHIAVLDEMNLARPEHYLAEVLSRMEARRPAAGGGFETAPLLDAPAPAVGLPANLGLIGTVNVDESAYGFSRKVLDRAFTLELVAGDLGAWAAEARAIAPEAWPVAAWHPRAVTLGGLGPLAEAERQRISAVVDALGEANRWLAPAGLGVGYRSRDEAALFVLHASETPDAFRTRDGEGVDPLDLALAMKLLPRIAGSTRSLRRALFGLVGWAAGGEPVGSEEEVQVRLDAFDRAGRPDALEGARFPRTAARLLRMTERLLADGYASFWG